MADINLTCTSCGRPVTVSEYADIGSLNCKACGTPLQAPTIDGEDEKRRPTIQKRNVTSAFTVPGEESEDDGAEAASHSDLQNTMITARENMKSKTKGLGSGARHMLLTSITFVLCGIFFAALKWVITPAMDAGTATLIQESILYALGALHVATVILSFKDDVFQGMLCSFIPLYSVYYLFMVQDNFWIRAITGGMLVGYGLDASQAMLAIGSGAFETIDTFISTGGGD